MELFLLFIIVIMMVVAQVNRNSKAESLEKKLSEIVRQLEALRHARFAERSREAVKETPVEKVEKPIEKTVVSAPVVPAPVVVIPPVIPPAVPNEPVPPVFIPEVIIPPVTPAKTVAPLPLANDKIAMPLKMAEKKPAEEKPPVKVAAEEKPKVKAGEPAQSARPKPVQVPKESWYDTFRKNNPDLEKFIGENILSKVAITVLVIGIAFFVKYAIDKDWINETARVGVGILCGGIVLGFAHQLHRKFAAFSSVLVAGGISIFYFTVGFAFHQYHLFNQTATFIMMLLITGFSVFISIAYNRVELAALSLIGGFATPFMVSTGQGNYQVLFVYVLILDAGMLVLAYLRRWNLINIMTYCFTMVLFVSWLETKVIGAVNAPYLGALIFGAAFYVIFILMNIVNNVKEKRKFGPLELSILISNTFLYFGEGLHILNHYHPEAKGIFSASMAIFNLVCSWLLFKRFKADKNLVYLLIGLTLTFITVSVPIQLHGNYITLVWAFESVMLIWLAQRSGIQLYRLTSIVVTILMFVSLFIDWDQAYNAYDEITTLNIVFNKGCLTGIFSALSLAAIAFLLKKEKLPENYQQPRFLEVEFNPRNYSIFLDVTAVVILYFSGLLETIYQLKARTGDNVAFYILLYAYHMVFLCVLNFGLPRNRHRNVDIVLYYFNVFTVILFVLWIAILPVVDFKENIIKTEMNHAGFLFHYVCLAAAVFLTLRLHRFSKQKIIVMPVKPAWSSAILSVAIVYLCSIELLLHVAQFGIRHVTDTSANSAITKLAEFDFIQIDVFKIGFPILWGLLAFAFLSFGMRRQNKTFRVSGLLLIAVILIKLFTYDIKDASEAGKIIAFIILGVVLLIISFMYQKIKALLVDDSGQQGRPGTATKPEADNNKTAL